MRINGVNRLARKVLMRDLPPKKKGNVDRHGRADPRGCRWKRTWWSTWAVLDAYRAIKLYLITMATRPPRERIQSPTDRART